MWLDRVIGAGWGRLTLGMVAAGVAATFAGFPAVWLQAGLEGKWDTLPPASEVLTATLALLPFGLVLAVLGGLPVHLLLAFLGRQGFLAYALGGAIGGRFLLMGLLYAAPAREAPHLVGAMLGLVGGLAFRALWRPRASNPQAAP